MNFAAHSNRNCELWGLTNQDQDSKNIMIWGEREKCVSPSSFSIPKLNLLCSRAHEPLQCLLKTSRYTYQFHLRIKAGYTSPCPTEKKLCQRCFWSAHVPWTRNCSSKTLLLIQCEEARRPGLPRQMNCITDFLLTWINFVLTRLLISTQRELFACQNGLIICSEVFGLMISKL